MMKQITLVMVGLMLISHLFSQDTMGMATKFDFWIGTWDATWDEGDGKMGKGINQLTKILDGEVIEENFEVLEGQSQGFKGISISVYQPALNRWKQAWCDNNGGYYDFEGEFHGDKRIFKTQVVERDGNQFIQRMVFKDIEKDKFTWDWEASNDGGKTWNLNWRIHYTRALNKEG